MDAAEEMKREGKKTAEEFWKAHREQIQHLAEQWGISVVLNLTEQQCGIQRAIELFLEEARKHEEGSQSG